MIFFNKMNEYLEILQEPNQEIAFLGTIALISLPNPILYMMITVSHFLWERRFRVSSSLSPPQKISEIDTSSEWRKVIENPEK